MLRGNGTAVSEGPESGAAGSGSNGDDEGTDENEFNDVEKTASRIRNAIKIGVIKNAIESKKIDLSKICPVKKDFTKIEWSTIDWSKIDLSKINPSILNLINAIDSGKPDPIIDEYVNTREFEVSIIDFYNQQSGGGKTLCSDETKDKCKIETLQNIILDANRALHIRFGAFVFLFTAYRREDHPNQVYDLVHNPVFYKEGKAIKCKEIFEGYPIYLQYELLSYTNKGEFTKNLAKDRLDDCNRLCKNLGETVSANIGAINAASEVIAAYAKHNILQSIRPEGWKGIIEEYIELLENSIKKNRYGHYSSFYATLGQLYAQNEQYQKAREYIHKAIDEDKTNQRSVRVMKWRNILLDIDTDEKTLEFKEEIDVIKRDYDKLVEEQKAQTEKNILMLTILSGFVGIIVGSMSIAGGISLGEGAAYIMAFMGCITVAIGLLVLALSGEWSQEGQRLQEGQKGIVVFLTRLVSNKGIVIILAGIMILVLFVIFTIVYNFVH